LRGQSGGREVVREIAMALPMVEEKHDVLATLWARKRIADLMSQDLMGAQRGVMQPEVQEQITQLGLGYRLMTQFTSFVAVEERIVNENGQPVRIEVPVEMPEGVSYQGVFGTSNGTANAPARMRVGGNVSGAVGSGGGIGAGVVGGVPGGMPGGSAGGVIGGTMSSVPVAAPPPPPPAAAPAPARQFDAGRLLAPSAVPKPIAMSRGSSGYLLSQKLDPALVTMLESGDQTSKVDVQILLGDTSAATMDLLKNLGFEVLQPAGRDLQVVGRIALDKLAELAQIPAVRYIVPVKGGPG